MHFVVKPYGVCSYQFSLIRFSELDAPPTETESASILRLCARGGPFGAIDYDELATKTHGWSGAELRNLCRLAYLNAVASGGEGSTAGTENFLCAINERGASPRKSV